MQHSSSKIAWAVAGEGRPWCTTVTYGRNAMDRSAMRLLAVLLVAVGCGAASADDTPNAKLLLIGKEPDHPYGSHMYLHTCGVLAKCLELNSGVEAAVSNGWPKEAAKLEGVKAIVIYTSPAAELLLDGPHRDEVAKVMKSGVGLVTIHWAS